MSTFTTFAIMDGSPSPVSVTYSPELVTAAETRLFDRRIDNRALQPSLRLSWSAPTERRKTFRSSCHSALPLVRTIAGIDVAPDTGRGETHFVLPSVMSLQERKHLFAMHVNALAHTLFGDMTKNLDPVRGG